MWTLKYTQFCIELVKLMSEQCTAHFSQFFIQVSWILPMYPATAVTQKCLNCHWKSKKKNFCVDEWVFQARTGLNAWKYTKEVASTYNAPWMTWMNFAKPIMTLTSSHESEIIRNMFAWRCCKDTWNLCSSYFTCNNVLYFFQDRQQTRGVNQLACKATRITLYETQKCLFKVLIV